MTRLFLDSEWANDALRELVSLALISEDGNHVFYAERDPVPTVPSTFVREIVYPLLERGITAMSDAAMTNALREFLARFESCQVLADAPMDFLMLDQVWSGGSKKLTPAPYTKKLVREDVRLMQLLEQYFCEHAEQLAKRHHALVDAQALRAAWLLNDQR